MTNVSSILKKVPKNLECFKEKAKAYKKEHKLSSLRVAQEQYAVSLDFKSFHEITLYYEKLEAKNLIEPAQKDLNAVMESLTDYEGNDDGFMFVEFLYKRAQSVIDKVNVKNPNKVHLFDFSEIELEEVRDCHFENFDFVRSILSLYNDSSYEKSSFLSQVQLMLSGLKFVNCTFTNCRFGLTREEETKYFKQLDKTENNRYVSRFFISSSFQGCTFTKTQFENVRLAFRLSITNCRFLSCRFEARAPEFDQLTAEGNVIKDPLVSEGTNSSRRYWDMYAASPFASSLSEQKAHDRSFYFYPKASMQKLITYLSEKSSFIEYDKKKMTRGIFMNNGNYYVVEDTSDGDAIVAWIDQKQMQHLKDQNIVEGNSYGGFKGRAIYDQSISGAKKYLSSLENNKDGAQKYDPKKVEVKKVSPQKEAAAKRKNGTLEAEERYQSGKMKDNSIELIAKHDLTEGTFIGRGEMQAKGYRYSPLTNDWNDGALNRISQEMLLCFEANTKIFVSKSTENNRKKVLVDHMKIHLLKKEQNLMMKVSCFPFASIFDASESLIGIEDKIYHINYLPENLFK